MDGKVVALILLVTGALMQAIITAGYNGGVPGWHENWLGISFIVIGASTLVWIHWLRPLGSWLISPYVASESEDSESQSQTVV